MRVRILFFGMLKDLVGRAGETIEVAEGASVADVLRHYESEIPRLKDALSSLALAVNQQYAGPDTKLKTDDEIALLPPVSGGAGERIARLPHAAIVRGVIDTRHVVNSLKRGEDGAALVFEGVVRNQTRGRKTLYLEYEAYEEMALVQLEKLAAESLEKFQIRDVAIVHRLGRLEIGEASVLIAVASAHRAAAFEACRWLIDTLKRTVPIWKKEFFEDGAVWADGEPFPAEILRANS
jgi:MoaE-MoaD fusion protein